MKIIPLFYFPTTVVVVDDEDNMINLLKAELSDEFKLIGTTSPLEAMNIVNNYKPIISPTDFFISNIDDTQHENTARIQFDYSKIIDLAANPERYELLSTIVSDYSMPEISGIDLCKRLQNNSIKKIMLTGKAGEDNVIEAFNWKIIDQYIKKTDSSTIPELKEVAREMSMDFFIELTQNLKFLSPRLALLNDALFAQFFANIIQEYSIKEFYLIDKNCSFLLIDKDGGQMVLVVASDEDLELFTNFYQDEPHAQKYLEKVIARKAMPFFGIGINPVNVNLTKWDKSFLDTNKLECSTLTIYWSIAKC